MSAAGVFELVRQQFLSASLMSVKLVMLDMHLLWSKSVNAAGGGQEPGGWCACERGNLRMEARLQQVLYFCRQRTSNEDMCLHKGGTG
jgi:hypothetical protein